MPRFTRKEIEKYYELIGVDPKQEGLIIKDIINLPFIGELFEMNEFDRKLPYSAKELSDSYSVLLSMIKDGFWYSSKKRREEAYNAAHAIIDDLNIFRIANYSVEDDYEHYTDKRNNLKIAIINGLCQVGDLVNFRLYQQNYTFCEIYNKIVGIVNEERKREKEGLDDEEKTSKELMTLYYLIALSKFYRTDDESKIFDGTGRIFLPNLKVLIKRRGITETQYEELRKQGYNIEKFDEREQPDRPLSFYVLRKKER